MSDDNEHIPVRLTRLETNVNRLTDDVKELTKVVSENIKSQSEIIHKLAEQVTSAGIPNWQTWAGFLAVVVGTIAIIFTMIDYNSTAINKEITHQAEISLLRDEITALKIQNSQNLVDSREGYLY